MAYELGMTFDAKHTAPKTEFKQVDFEAMNTYKVDAVGISAKPKTIVGYISGVINLGQQIQEDAKMVSNLTPEGEAELIAKHTAEGKQTYFEDGIDPQTKKQVRYQRWPQKPQQMVAITVDFPQIPVDMGQFFGESKVRPLRMLLNGEFTVQGTRVVGRPYVVKHVKHSDGTFAFAKNSTIHKMAEAADLLDEKGYFYAKDLFRLVGKPLMYKVQVWLKENGGKKYLQEDISFAGAIPEGLPVPEVSEDLAKEIFYGVTFTDPKIEDVKDLRVSVKNTIKRAVDYEGSKIQEVLQELEASYQSNSGATTTTPTTTPTTAKTDEPQKAESTPAPTNNVEGVDFDEDVPF